MNWCRDCSLKRLDHCPYSNAQCECLAPHQPIVEWWRQSPSSGSYISADGIWMYINTQASNISAVHEYRTTGYKSDIFPTEFLAVLTQIPSRHLNSNSNLRKYYLHHTQSYLCIELKRYRLLQVFLQNISLAFDLHNLASLTSCALHLPPLYFACFHSFVSTVTRKSEFLIRYLK